MRVNITHCCSPDVCSLVDEHQHSIVEGVKQDQYDPDCSRVKEDLRVLEILTSTDSRRMGVHCYGTLSRC